MMLVDTDVLIWNLRGNDKAAALLDRQTALAISAVSYMELVQGLRNKQEMQALRQALRFWSAEIIHISDAISARACFLMEEHALGDSLQLADALIAATALEHGLELHTANVKHYRKISGMILKQFRV